MNLFNDEKNRKIQLKSEEDDEREEESEDIQNIKQMGVPNMPNQNIKDIQCITIIGEIEGHFAGNPQKNLQNMNI